MKQKLKSLIATFGPRCVLYIGASILSIILAILFLLEVFQQNQPPPASQSADQSAVTPNTVTADTTYILVVDNTPSEHHVRRIEIPESLYRLARQYDFEISIEISGDGSHRLIFKQALQEAAEPSRQRRLDLVYDSAASGDDPAGYDYWAGQDFVFTDEKVDRFVDGKWLISQAHIRALGQMMELMSEEEPPTP